MLRKLLIATLHFPPCAGSGVFRMLGFARHLPTFDWQTTVVAPPKMPWEPVDEALVRRIPQGTVVHQVRYPQSRLWKTLKQAATYEWWLPRAVPACARMVVRERPDAVLTSGPPHAVHLLGSWLKRRYGLPWVADFRDPWIAGGWQRRGLRRRWETHCERRVIRDADLIVANAPLACVALQQAFPDHSGKMISITNGFDSEDFPTAEASAAPSRAADSSTAIQIVHTGDVYFQRDPRPLLEAVQGLSATSVRGRGSVTLCFIGRTHSLNDEVRQRGMEALVEIRDQVAYQQALEEMTKADILLLLDAPGRRTGVPAKLYEYLGAGRPILALAESDGDTAWVLRESGVLHRLARSDDIPGIQKGLAELVDASTAWRGRPATTLALAQFTRQHTAGQLAEKLDTLVGSRRSVAAAASLIERERAEVAPAPAMN
jgi:Glycosyl transferase 4-like domain